MLEDLVIYTNQIGNFETGDNFNLTNFRVMYDTPERRQYRLDIMELKNLKMKGNVSFSAKTMSEIVNFLEEYLVEKYNIDLSEFNLDNDFHKMIVDLKIKEDDRNV